MMGKPIKKTIVPEADIAKWTELGWIIISPAFTKGHFVVAWVKDGRPKEPADGPQQST